MASPLTGVWGQSAGTHGFVIDAFDNPVEAYEVEFYVESERFLGDDLVLAMVGPEDFDVA